MKRAVSSAQQGIDATTVYNYLKEKGVPELKLREAADGISRTVQQLTDPGMEGLYQKPSQQLFDFGIALPVERPATHKAPSKSAVLEARWREDCAKGLAGDSDALGRAIEAKGRASSILPDLVETGMPQWDVRGFKVENPQDIASLLMPIRSPYFESLKVAVLDKNQVIQHSEVISVGSLNESIAHPREILRPLQRLGEKSKFNSIILAHNHPSGDPSPSDADRRLTRRVEEICAKLGYTVLDHVITNGERYFSFRELGILMYDPAPARPKGVGKLQPMKAPKHEPGRLAPWEIVSRSALPRIDEPELTRQVVKGLRSDPAHGHVLYLSTRYNLLGVERVPNIMTLEASKLHRLVFEGTQREGAYAFVVDFGHARGGAEFLEKMRGLRSFAQEMQVNFLDAMDWDSQVPSAKARGLMEASPLFASAAAHSQAESQGPLSEVLKGMVARSSPGTGAAASLSL